MFIGDGSSHPPYQSMGPPGPGGSIDRANSIMCNANQDKSGRFDQVAELRADIMGVQPTVPRFGPSIRHHLALRWRPISFVLLLTVLATSTVVFPAVADIAGALGLLIGYATGGRVALRRAKAKEGRERLVWRLIGAGLTSAASGVALVFLLEAFGVHPPAFGPIDILFIGGYVGILAGAAVLPNAFAGRRDLARTYIDGIVGAISISALGWVLVVGDLVDYFNAASSWARWLGTAYPAFDILTIILFVTLMSRRSLYRLDLRLALLAGGAAFQVAADLTFLTGGVPSSFAAARPIYPLFIAASACLAGSAYFANAAPKGREYTERSIHQLAAAAPYGVALTLTVVTLVSLPFAGFDSAAQILTMATLIVGALVMLRQGLAIHDNRIHVDQKVRDLASSISHELRTPLTAVVGFLDLLSDPDSGLESEERSELTDTTIREANRMSRIVSDVSLLTHLDPSEIALTETSNAVADLMTQTLHTVRTSDSEIEVVVQGGLSATFDCDRMGQVMVNLIENAIRYGDGKITLVAQDRSGDLVLEVHDNGPGVPKHDRHIIWQRFERGAYKYNAAIPGSGVGLAVVTAIAASHGGEATYVDSNILGGACFSITLPDRCLNTKRSSLIAALQTG